MEITYRDMNGAGNLVIFAVMLIFAIWLLWRGGHEKPWWRPIPGRLVIGAFFLSYSLLRLEEAFYRLSANETPGYVGSKINDLNTVIGIWVTAYLGVWSVIRFIRNDLEANDGHGNDDNSWHSRIPNPTSDASN